MEKSQLVLLREEDAMSKRMQTYEVLIQKKTKDVITPNGSLWWYQNKITQLPSGTKNETFQTISVYPNPVSDEINMDELSDKINFLTVINSFGQEVLRTTLDYGKANVKSLSSGQYLIVIQDESGKKVGQQIILKQ